jgi:hypothetical protein
MFEPLIRVIQEATVPNIVNNVFSDKRLHWLPERTFKTLQVHSLQSIVNYCNDVISVDEVNISAIVVDYNSVRVFGIASKLSGERDELVKATSEDNSFKFGTWLKRVNFQIHLMSNFVENADRQELIQLIGLISNEEVSQTDDDGISQSVQIKRGISRVGTNTVKPIFRLQPYRTFREVEQPESDFLFRLQGKGEDIECALFEADGCSWKVKARQSIGEYLIENINMGRILRPENIPILC